MKLLKRSLLGSALLVSGMLGAWGSGQGQSSTQAVVDSTSAVVQKLTVAKQAVSDAKSALDAALKKDKNVQAALAQMKSDKAAKASKDVLSADKKALEVAKKANSTIVSLVAQLKTARASLRALQPSNGANDRDEDEDHSASTMHHKKKK